MFQVHAEQRNRRQFGNTIEHLRVLTSFTFSRYSKFLVPLFEDKSTPVVNQPIQDKSEITIKKDSKENNVEVYVPSHFDKMVYQEKIKTLINEESTLMLTTESLYNIVWGTMLGVDAK